MVLQETSRTRKNDSLDIKSSFALERADHELGGTGLLTRDLLLSDCAFPPLTGSGSCSRENDRLQLRGSGGFSPRFPNIPPANLPYAGSTTGKHLPWHVAL